VVRRGGLLFARLAHSCLQHESAPVFGKAKIRMSAHMRKLLFGLFLLSHCHCVASEIHKASGEQSEFSTEGQVLDAIPVPSAIRKLLEEDSFVKETLDSESPPLKSLPEDWTLCSVIHLGDEKETDYIVVGQRSLTGAHATHFWVFRETSNGVKLVLAAFSDSLSVGERRTNGLRDISTLYYTAVSDGTIRWTFNGTKYRTSHMPKYR
jgi:hypothetical protein